MAIGGGESRGGIRNFEETLASASSHKKRRTVLAVVFTENERINLALAYLLGCFLPDFTLPGTRDLPFFPLFYCFTFACASLANYYYLAPFAFFCFFFCTFCGALENAMDGRREGA